MDTKICNLPASSTCLLEYIDAQLYLDVVEVYLQTDDENRKMIKKEAPHSISDTIRVIEGFQKKQFMHTWINRAIHNTINDLERKMVNFITRFYSELTAYKLGVVSV